MFSRKEIENLIGKALPDEVWAKNAEIMSQIEERMWEEDHPQDE